MAYTCDQCGDFWEHPEDRCSCVAPRAKPDSCEKCHGRGTRDGRTCDDCSGSGAHIDTYSESERQAFADGCIYALYAIADRPEISDADPDGSSLAIRIKNIYLDFDLFKKRVRELLK